MKLSEKIIKKTPTPYQVLAKKHKVSYTYVASIAVGIRKPNKKKGLAILNDLKKLAGVQE